MNIRPFSPCRDIPGVVRLRAEVEAVDHEGADTSEATLRAQLTLPGHDPARDRWVIEKPGEPDQLVGYALAWLPPQSPSAHLFVVVHPGWRRKGLGSALMSRALDRARSLGATQATANASESHPWESAFLQKHGFAPAGAYTEMRAPADIRLPNPIWPYGYQLRTYAEMQDVAILTEAMNRCYEGLWGHHEASQAQMAEWLPEFTPEGLFLVFSEKGRVVGISRVEVSPARSEKNSAPTGYIDAPGLVPQHRRLDLYRALLITGVRWLQGQRQEIIELESWGDRPAVLDEYRELGFSVLRRVVEYALTLPGSPPVPVLWGRGEAEGGGV